MRKRVAHEQALWYEEELNKEIEKDRLAHGKKPVSYTHLDVYKRQLWERENRENPSSVSIFRSIWLAADCV